MKRFFTLLVVVFAAFSFAKAADIIVTSFLEDADNPAGTFRQAVADAQSGDVIKFNIPYGTITLNSSITIKGVGKVLTIDGMNMATNTPVILTENGGGRVFSIANGTGSEGMDLTIKNFIIQDVAATVNGAAFSSGHSDFTDVFKNTGEYAFKVRLENCYIKNCSETATLTSGGGGGYFLSHGSDVTIVNCTFEGNSVIGGNTSATGPGSYGGGAIGSTGSNTARLTIINSTFVNNSSDARGGALYLGHPTNIINCTIVDNQSTRCGGIYFHNGDIAYNVVNTIAINNIALTANTDRGDMDRNNGNISVTYSLFEKTNLTEATGLGEGNIVLLGSTAVFAGGSSYALADNGGSTPTIALASNSDVLKKGIAVSGDLPIPTTDQRGAPRLSPPSMGAYDNPDYVFTGLPQTAKLPLAAWSDGKQINVYSENPGWATVYDLTGNMLMKSYVKDVSTLPAVGAAGIYLIRVTDNAGNATTTKVIVK